MYQPNISSQPDQSATESSKSKPWSRKLTILVSIAGVLFVELGLTVILLIWSQGTPTPSEAGSFTGSKTGKSVEAIGGTLAKTPVIGDVVTIFNLQVSKRFILITVVTLVALLVTVSLLIVYQCTTEDATFKLWYVPVIAIVIIIIIGISIVNWRKQPSEHPIEYLRMLERHGDKPYNHGSFVQIYNKFVEERKSHYAARKMCRDQRDDSYNLFIQVHGIGPFRSVFCRKEAIRADLFFHLKLDVKKQMMFMGYMRKNVFQDLSSKTLTHVALVPLDSFDNFFKGDQADKKALAFKYLQEMEKPIYNPQAEKPKPIVPPPQPEQENECDQETKDAHAKFIEEYEKLADQLKLVKEEGGCSNEKSDQYKEQVTAHENGSNPLHFYCKAGYRPIDVLAHVTSKLSPHYESQGNIVLRPMILYGTLEAADVSYRFERNKLRENFFALFMVGDKCVKSMKEEYGYMLEDLKKLSDPAVFAALKE